MEQHVILSVKYGKSKLVDHDHVMTLIIHLHDSHVLPKYIKAVN